MAYPTVKKFKDHTFSITMADISAASSVFVAMPFRGRVKRAYVTIQNAITSADSALTGKINGTAITGFTGTATNAASAAGTVYTMADATALNDFVAGDAIELITDGASSTTAIANWTLVVESY